MPRTWKTTDTEFLKENWNKMSNISLGIELHKTSRTISHHAGMLKLPPKKPGPAPFTPKREWSKRESDNPRMMKCIPRSDSNHAVNAYHNYIKAMIVRNKLIEFKKTFQVSGRLKLVIDMEERRGSGTNNRIVTGDVINVSPYFITMQLDKYIENFQTAAFFTGEVAII